MITIKEQLYYSVDKETKEIKIVNEKELDNVYQTEFISSEVIKDLMMEE